MAQGNGYWVKGSKIYPISIHIDYIIKNPEKFNTSKEELKKIYKKFKEPFGFEGKARGEIMTNIMKDGWLRVRQLRTPVDMWTIQFDNYSRRKAAIKSFVTKFYMETLYDDDMLHLIDTNGKYNENIKVLNFLNRIQNEEIEVYEMTIENQYNSVISILKESAST